VRTEVASSPCGSGKVDTLSTYSDHGRKPSLMNTTTMTNATTITSEANATASTDEEGESQEEIVEGAVGGAQVAE
jgi:hypothetical protein